ncbi:CRPV-102 [Crowpox virus]|nr:CRPV-102 [Crowpox virus]
MTEVIVQIQDKVLTSQFLYPSYGTKIKDILLSVR